mgnify:CR=1 FL=1
MKKQNDLQWFLIKKFIEILAVVGVVEYLLTFLVNRFVLPNVLLYFFPGVEENPLLLGSGVIFFLSAVFNVTDLRSIECNVSITAS